MLLPDLEKARAVVLKYFGTWSLYTPKLSLRNRTGECMEFQRAPEPQLMDEVAQC